MGFRLAQVFRFVFLVSDNRDFYFMIRHAWPE